MKPPSTADCLVYGHAAAKSGEGRHYREALGISLREFGLLASLSPSAVLRYERGERTPRGPAAIRYGRALLTLATLQSGLQDDSDYPEKP